MKRGMNKSTKRLAWVLGLAMVGAVPSVSYAKHVGYDGEIGRARVELTQAERNWQCTVDDLNRARAALDAARGKHHAIAAGIDNLARDAQRARRDLDAAQAPLRLAQTDFNRAQVHVGDLVRHVQDTEARAAGARQYVETVRARLIADFENGQLRYALAEVASAQARLDQARNAVVGYLETSPRFRAMRAEERRITEEIYYLNRRRPVDHRKVDAAERALAQVRRDIDDEISRAMSQDLAAREATIAFNTAQGRVDELRRCFERDLPRHRDVLAAYAAVAREEEALNCARRDLAGAEQRLAAIQREVERHTVCVAEASRRAQCADEEFAKAQTALNCAVQEIAGAEALVRRAADAEAVAHVGRDRAASRVVFLERRTDDRGRDGWAGRDDHRHDHGNHYGRERRADQDDRDDRFDRNRPIARNDRDGRDGRSVWTDVRFERR